MMIENQKSKIGDRQSPLCYAICCTSRTGSTWLCDLLKLTGKLGHPGEHFGGQVTRRQDDLGVYMQELLATKATENGVYGAKGTAQTLAPYFKYADVTKHILLRRRDTLRQAISLYRHDVEKGSGVICAKHPQGRRRQMTPDPFSTPFDAEGIMLRRRWIRLGNEAWAELFAERKIEPLEVWYEQLRADPPATLRRIAEFIGVGQIDYRPSAMKKQADETTELWAARLTKLRNLFRSEWPEP